MNDEQYKPIPEVNDEDRLEKLRIQTRQKVEQTRAKLQDINNLVKNIRTQKRLLSNQLSEKVREEDGIKWELKEETDYLEELSILKPGEKTLEELRNMYTIVHQFVGGFAAAKKDNQWFHILRNGSPAYEARWPAFGMMDDGLSDFDEEGEASVVTRNKVIVIRKDGSIVREEDRHPSGLYSEEPNQIKSIYKDEPKIGPSFP